MNLRRPMYSFLALLVCLLLAIPSDVGAQGGQSAGKITAVVPIVDVVRGPQQVPASTSQQVFWGDVINTGHLARARVALNDGSILNVGSDSNLKITRHDAGEQQTELELNYGRVRSRAVKLVKPNASYEIRTPTGVAGVVGTDFEISSDNDQTQVVVFEGKVRFCGLRKKTKEEQAAEEANPPTPEQRKKMEELLPCVIVAAGAMSTVRFNEAPSQPVPATPLTVTEAVNSTSPTGSGGAGGGISGGAAGGAGGGIGAGTGVAVGVGAAVAATVATVVVRSVATTKNCPAPAGTRVPAASCGGTTPGKIPGQK